MHGLGSGFDALRTAPPVACMRCTLRDLCLPLGLMEDELDHPEIQIGKRRKLVLGQPAFRAGDPFEMIYAVRTGFLKTEMLAADGRSQVTGFQMAGEVVGLDGIGEGFHNSTAIALEDSEVCQVPFNELEALAEQEPSLRRQLHKIMSREIMRDQGVMLMLGALRAEERLIAFLLNLSERFASRGYSPVEFHLRMSREEISSYLGVKVETISRAFSYLRDVGLIAVHKKHIRLLDITALKARLATPATGKSPRF
ncbi:MAG: transcriptional regulator [Betaproteobacteria bacterium HGW-Betaproteobacteria-11]|nr:MAG: transcriptional regulator [Betaproteobacteria bacterium HGW-Betaproteobacteria-11]